MIDIDVEEFERSRQQLGQHLRRLRVRARQNVSELARSAGMSASKLSRLELGRITPSESDARQIAHALGLSVNETTKLVVEARGVRHLLELSRPSPDVASPGRQALLANIEADTHVFDEFATNHLPGLLQTPQYIEAIAKSTLAIGTTDAQDISELMMMRMRRQALLFDDKRHFHFIVLESVLELRLAAEVDLVRQIEHIVEMARRPNIEVSIVPAGVRWPALSLEDFVIMDDKLVFIEGMTRDRFLRQRDELETYIKFFGLARDIALHGEESARLLEQIRDEHLSSGVSDKCLAATVRH